MEGYNVTTLEATGFEGPVSNHYWKMGSDTLLIMLPGLGYTNQMPLMFYIHQIGIRRKWDILLIDYDYSAVPRDTSAEEWGNRMYADTHPLIDQALATGDYQHVILAGKSIGTNVMTTLLRRGFDKATIHIWLTPLFRSEAVRTAIMNTPNSLAVFGDEDFAIQNVDLGAIYRGGVPMIIMPGGDHSMMMESSIPESISGLAQTMFDLETWLVNQLKGTQTPS